MHKSNAILAIVALSLWSVLPAAHGAGPVAESQVFIQDAIAAYRAGDLPGYVDAMEDALELNPASLSTQYNLACGYALVGRADDAIALLQQLSDTGMDFGQARDPDLDTLRDDPRFDALLTRLQQRVRTRESSEPYFEFPQRGIVPEGIAHDAQTDRLFFSSMRTGDIFVMGPDKRVSRFASLPTDGRMSAIGLTTDSQNSLLWVAASAFPLAENYEEAFEGHSGVFAFDLTTGDLKHDYRLTDSGFGLNDVTLSPSGEIFASGQRVYRVHQEDGVLRPVETSIELFGTNGITVHENGRTLFTASYPVGVATVDIDSGEARFLELPDTLSLYGVDGLYWHDEHLYAIQNGARPWRLLRLSLDRDLQSVISADVLELGNDATAPMTGAIVGNTMYYVGEGAQPDELPSQFPETLRGNLGTVVIRSIELTQ